MTDEDAVPGEQESAVTVPGDVWILGDHRLLCGDATQISDVEKVMAGGLADMVWSDPPYNVKIAGHVTRSKSAKNHDFAMAQGEMSSQQFQSFLETAQ